VSFEFDLNERDENTSLPVVRAIAIYCKVLSASLLEE